MMRGAGKLGWRLGAVLLATTLAVGLAGPLLADEGHDHGGALTLTGGPLLWGLVSLGGVFLCLVLSRAALFRGRPAAPAAEGAAGYFAAVRHFSRNARLFLAYSILAELGTGIWSVMFNLYLLRTGFPITFVATFWLVNMVCHGTAALPAGLVADRYGRRRSFFVATFISILAQGTLLFMQHPTAILALGGLAGLGEAFHGVTGAPFMMENSEPRERPHLFSLNSAFLQFSRFAGSLSGGLLPLAWAALMGVPDIDPQAARWALVTGLPLVLVSLVPLVFMREKRVELAPSFRALLDFRGLPSFGNIVRLTLLSLMVGTAFGLTIRFFNVFFQDVHHASDSQIGAVLGLGSIAGASAVLISPVLAQRWGKVKSIFYTQALSIPFLLLMAVLPSLSAVTALFLVRGALYGISQPLRGQLGMEVVGPRERGTTAGFTHTSFDLGGGVGAGIAGVLISGGGFVLAFAVASVLVLVPAFLYYVFFAHMEARARQPAGLPEAAPTSAGN